MSLAGAGGAAAAEGNWQSAEVAPGTIVEARLIAAVEGTGTLESIPAGLHVRLPEPWKTYWRSPGDAGLPPEADWSGSANVADAALSWPAPHRFTLFGIDTFGYADEVVFPLAATPARPGEPVALDARVDLLVCSDLCVPTTFDLDLALPAGPAAIDPDAANLIDRFRALVPGDGTAAGVTVEAVAAGEAGGGAGAAADRLSVAATARTPFADPDVFIEADGPWAFGAPEMTLSDDGRRLRADLPVLQAPPGAPPLAGLPVTVTLVDGPRAVEHTAVVGAPGDRAGPALPAAAADAAPDAAPDAARGSPAAGAAPAAAEIPVTAFAGMLGLAVLGGLILNLMPCVLPVLSLKLLSVVGHGGQAPQRVRLGFLASAAGILASFLVLAAGAIALKSAGGAVGWGIQFQQPLFLVFIILVLTLFACNLLGLFEITLPSGLGDRLARAGGGGTGGGDGLAGHFATGAFATLLATPCSAPFLGTAVGFALSRGAAEILAVFVALGVGLALPYLAVAAMPRLATRLPRPGRWMVTLKRVLSLALILTAVWLLAVLAVQVSAAAAWGVAGAMAGLAALLWARHRTGSGRLRLAGGALAAALAVAAFAVPVRLDAPPPAAGPETGAAVAAAVWQPFDRARIDALVAEGGVVFVDVTADWCLTCQANKALVLDRGAVPAALAGAGVVAMRADWTRPDDRIAAYLAEHGRYGIPFNAAYGPGAPDGVVLPELLTASAVLDALEAAGGTARTAGRGADAAGGSGASGG